MPEYRAFPLIVTALMIAPCHVGVVSAAGESDDPLCRPLLDESVILLTDATLDLDISRSELAAFAEIYGLVKGLWDADAIPELEYLEAKYDFDSARLSLERAKLLVERQTALAEQYDLICRGAKQHQRAIDDAYERYRRADCAALEKTVEVNAVDLEFAEQFLASVIDLREGDVATRQDVIRAELDVEREGKKLTDARKRSEACREALATFDEN